MNPTFRLSTDPAVPAGKIRAGERRRPASPAQHPATPRVFECAPLWRGAEPLLDALSDRYGHLRLDRLQGSYGWVLKWTERERASSHRINTLGDYLALFRQGVPDLPYLTHLSVNRHLPELRNGLVSPAEFGPNWVDTPALDRLSGPELFLGPAGSGFGLIHVDHAAVHVGFWQVQGEKRFVLFPPEDGRYLYRFRGAQFPWQLRNSRVTASDYRNFARYPLLRHAHPQTLVLRAGQCLLLPANWWHSTENLSHSISYSIRIINGSNVLQTLAAYALGLPRGLLRAVGR
jgi:hypothetical protein